MDTLRDMAEYVLGAFMVDPTLVVEHKVPIDTFHIRGHQILYSAILESQESHNSVDPILVANILESKGDLNRIGGSVYLYDLHASVVETQSIGYYLEQLQQHRTRTHMAALGKYIQEKAVDTEVELPSLLDHIYKKVMEVGEEATPSRTRHIADVLDELEEKEHNWVGTTTGFLDLDLMTMGLQKGELMTVGATTSRGKTAFALNIMANISAIHDIPTLMFTLEMPAWQLASRLMAYELNTPFPDFYQNQRYSEVKSTLASKNILINESSGITLPELRTEATRQKTIYPDLGLVVVDYLQLLRLSKGIDVEHKVAEMTEVVYGCKSLAGDIQVPVLALSQLSRQANYRPGEFELHFLKESSGIEQFSDRVMFLHREDGSDTANLIIKKNRINGQIGEITLGFEQKSVRFYNL